MQSVGPSPRDIVARRNWRAWGVNLHDNDLVPIDAKPAERDRIVRDFQTDCAEHNVSVPMTTVPMTTVNLFYHPVFRDGLSLATIPQYAPMLCRKRPWIFGGTGR
jgi:hypothetical protein